MFEQRRYWAFCSNPDYYRIEDAVAEVEFDNWVTKGSDIHAGDRAVIWKAKGHSGTTGIIALAEVVGKPAAAPDLHPEYQRNADPLRAARPPEEMATIRYVRAPHLPLWIDGPMHDLLSALSIARGGARRSVYHIEPDEWAAIMAAVDGWPEQGTDIPAAVGALTWQSGERGAGQGFVTDSRVRRTIESHAMDLATRHYQRHGWHVEDVSSRKPYDLHCTDAARGELRVEVKGTTSSGASVFLTANEVSNAKAHFPHVALCVVSNIRLVINAQGEATALEGDLTSVEPWQVSDGDVLPLTYSYVVPVRGLH